MRTLWLIQSHTASTQWSWLQSLCLTPCYIGSGMPLVSLTWWWQLFCSLDYCPNRFSLLNTPLSMPHLPVTHSFASQQWVYISSRSQIAQEFGCNLHLWLARALHRCLCRCPHHTWSFNQGTETLTWCHENPWYWRKPNEFMASLIPSFPYLYVLAVLSHWATGAPNSSVFSVLSGVLLI